MSLIDQIKQDQLCCRKEGLRNKAAFLGTLVSEISTIAKNDGCREVTDADASVVLQKWAKNAKEVISYAPGAEAIDSAKEELSWLSEYLPKQMSEAELRGVIEAIVDSSSGNVNIGTIMRDLKQSYDGQFDGKSASMIAKDVLG